MAKASENLNMELLSRNRDVIYTFSMLWIMLFHLSCDFTGLAGRFQDLGEAGVDVFLFVSGISLHFSLRRCTDLIAFYRRRLIRVMLPAFLVAVPWFAAQYFLTDRNLTGFFFNALCLGIFYDGNRMVWFIPAICICYLISPLIYRFFEKLGWQRKALLLALAACIPALVLLRCFYGEFWPRIEILWRRIPIFLVGSYCGKAVYEKKTIPLNPIHALLLAAVFAAGCMVYPDTRLSRVLSIRYLYIPTAVFFSMAYSLLGQFGSVKKVSARLAPITLEVYLLQEKINVVLAKTPLGRGTGAQNIAAVVLTFAGAFLLLKLEKLILSKIRKPSHKLPA